MTVKVPLGNGNQLKISLKKIFFPLLLLVAVVIVLFKFSELREIGRLFAQAKWYWLVVALLSQITNNFIQASVYKSALNMLGIHKFNIKYLFRSSAMVYFLNYAIPSLGSAGHITFFKIMQKKGVPDGKSLMVILIELLCYYASFILLVLLSLVYMFFKLGNIGHTQVVAAAGFGLLMLVVASIVYFFLGKKHRAKKRLTWLAEKVDYFEDGKRDEDRIHELIREFYDSFNWLKVNKRKLTKPLILQFVKFLSDGVTIFVIFLAFGSLVPVGLGVIAFAFGRLFGMISFLPAGVGAFEGAMVLVFSSLGQPLELALSVMLVYRFYSFWLYFPFGLIFYRQLTHNKKLLHDPANWNETESDS